MFYANVVPIPTRSIIHKHLFNVSETNPCMKIDFNFQFDLNHYKSCQPD